MSEWHFDISAKSFPDWATKVFGVVHTLEFGCADKRETRFYNNNKKFKKQPALCEISASSS